MNAFNQARGISGKSALALLLLALSLPAHAATWRVDLIVFRYLRAVEEGGQPAIAPSLRSAIELDEQQKLSAAGITILPDEEFGLRDHWAQLRGSPQFRPLIRLAWTQNDPPDGKGPRLHLKSGETVTVPVERGIGAREFNEIDGTIGLGLGRFLHLDADLVYTTVSVGEEATSWRLAESRRMRSDELHHLDSPKLGIIAIVSKWEPALEGGGDH